jgi:hypothetical protein
MNFDNPLWKEQGVVRFVLFCFMLFVVFCGDMLRCFLTAPNHREPEDFSDELCLIVSNSITTAQARTHTYTQPAPAQTQHGPIQVFPEPEAGTVEANQMH